VRLVTDWHADPPEARPYTPPAPEPKKKRRDRRTEIAPSITSRWAAEGNGLIGFGRTRQDAIAVHRRKVLA
jgi:hypothetical protein